MSVFAVPRSIARSREKSLYIQLNMERFEPLAAGERGARRQQRRASDATRAGARLCPGSALEFERAHRSANPRGEPSLTVSVECHLGDRIATWKMRTARSSRGSQFARRF